MGGFNILNVINIVWQSEGCPLSTGVKNEHQSGFEWRPRPPSGRAADFMIAALEQLLRRWCGSNFCPGEGKLGLKQSNKFWLYLTDWNWPGAESHLVYQVFRPHPGSAWSPRYSHSGRSPVVNSPCCCGALPSRGLATIPPQMAEGCVEINTRN